MWFTPHYFIIERPYLAPCGIVGEVITVWFCKMLLYVCVDMAVDTKMVKE